MPAIGHVTHTSNGGFKGQLRTLSIKANVEIMPNESKSNDTQPDYRVLSDGTEIGADRCAGRKRRGAITCRSRWLLPSSGRAG